MTVQPCLAGRAAAWAVWALAMALVWPTPASAQTKIDPPSVAEGQRTYFLLGQQRVPVVVSADEVAVVAGAQQPLRPAAQAQGRMSRSGARIATLTSNPRFAVLSGLGTGKPLSRAEVSEAWGGAKAYAVLHAGGHRDQRLLLTGEVIVHYPEDWAAAEIAAVEQRYGLTLVAEYTIGKNIRSYTLAGDADPVAVSVEIATQTGVPYAYPAYIDTRKAPAKFKVNDPYFNAQWYLRNTGQGGGLQGEDLNIASVWNVYTGSVPEVVCVVDGWVDGGHRDLNNALDRDLVKDYSIDLVANPTPLTTGTPLDSDPHGTNVAGVIAARGGNGLGIIGVAPRARLAAHRVFVDGAFIASPEEEADSQVRNNRYIDIYNNSWGVTSGSVLPTAANPLTLYAWENGVRYGRGGLGSIFLFAGGNFNDLEDNTNYSGYSSNRHIITVAASTNFGAQAWYSNPGSTILVNAPSNGGSLGVMTTDYHGDAGQWSGDYSPDFGGTSAATPMVSGVVALMLQANPNLTWQDVRHILMFTATKNDPLLTEAVDPRHGWMPPVADSRNSRLWYSHVYGFGRVNADLAARTAANFISTGPRTAVTLNRKDVANVLIPDLGQTTRELRFDQVTGDKNLFVEYVEVVIHMPEHTFWRDLDIRLTSPSGTTSRLSDHFLGSAVRPNTGLNHVIFGSVRHYGEPALNGEQPWTLVVDDEVAVDEGTLVEWSITLYGRPDQDNDGFGDGLPDDWERYFFGGNGANLDAIGPTDDPNGDGKTNWEHFVDGTDPVSREIVVYNLSQQTTQVGQSNSEKQPRKGILVNERGNDTLRAVLSYREDGVQWFHEEQWGQMLQHTYVADPSPTPTDPNPPPYWILREPAVQKFVASGLRRQTEIIAATDYADADEPDNARSELFWSRVLRGTTGSKATDLGLSRAALARSLKGDVVAADAVGNLLATGKLTARVNKPLTLIGNRPNYSAAEVVRDYKAELAGKGMIERRLTMALSTPAIVESAGAGSVVVTVSRSTSTLRPLTIYVRTNDNTEATLTPGPPAIPGDPVLPTMVRSYVIPAGSTSVSFTLDVLDDAEDDGSDVDEERPHPVVEIWATAVDHTPAVQYLTVRDDDGT